MIRSFEVHVSENGVGKGWYWELKRDQGVLARGLAATHSAARAQATDAARKVTDDNHVVQLGARAAEATHGTH